MRYSWIALLLLLCVGNVWAGEYNFENSADGIVKALTKEPIIKKRRGTARGIRINNIDRPTQSVNMKIEFDVNSYVLRGSSEALLKELGKALLDRKLAKQTIFIKGHTDSDGTDSSNLKLSFQRALTVKQYLTANYHIDEKRLEVMGYGERVPIVPNTSLENKQINRRVEISVK